MAAAMVATVMMTGPQVSAGGSETSEVECIDEKSTSERLFNGGAKSASLGIVLPPGAIVTRIDVLTEDDYDAFGVPGSRTVANQNDETVVVEIGGVQVGTKTIDVPDDESSSRYGQQTTTVFTGRQAASGPVVVKHVGNSSSPNSVVAKTVAVWWTIPGYTCDGGTYPPQPEITKAPVDGVTTGVILVPAGGTQQGQNPPAVVTPVAGVAAPTQQPAPVVPDVVAQPATTGAATQVLTANVTPTAATVGAAGSLPATGSQSVDTLQLAAAAGAAGMGMLLVSRRRRRSTHLRVG